MSQLFARITRTFLVSLFVLSLGSSFSEDVGKSPSSLAWFVKSQKKCSLPPKIARLVWVRAALMLLRYCDLLRLDASRGISLQSPKQKLIVFFHPP